MSSSWNHETNDQQQPPSKRQRILPEGTRGTCATSSVSGTGSAQSRLMSPPRRVGKTRGDSSSSVVVSIRPPTDSGPIFTDVQEIDGYSCSSIESALGVPTRIMFRQVGGDKKKEEEEEEGATSNNANKSSRKKKNKRRLRPLLSRQEAEQFLRLTLLAQEIDVLVDLSETVLSRRQFARRFRREVLMQSDANSPPAVSSKDRPWKNPWLATLGPILDVLEQRQSNPSRQQFCQWHNNNNNNNNFVSNQQQNPQEEILHHIHNELTRLYHGLQACGVYELERSAEQNRSLVASLTDILGFDDDGHGDGDGDDDDNNDDSGRTCAVRKLAREKQSLSKLQDLLAKRVRSLLVVLCHSRTATTAESSAASDNGATMDVDGDDGDNNKNSRNQILFDEHFSSTSTDGNIDNTGNEKNPSTKKKASHEEDNDDESSVLSLDEILIPLEVVCEKLFARADRKTTAATTMEKIHNENDYVDENCCDKSVNDDISGCIEPTAEEKQQPIHQEKMGVHPTNNDSSLLKAATTTTATTMTAATDNVTAPDSTVEDSDPMATIPLEFSQRTVGAAATIMELAGKAEQEYTAPKKVTIQPGSGEEDSDPIAMMITAETSQKTMGAADTMMALAMEAGNDFTTHKTVPAKADPIHKGQNNRHSKVNIGDTTNRNNPHTQHFSANDDDSFVDDPTPSDGEDGYDETTNKENATGCNDNATSNLGIFDVVDVLTPQSQSSQQKEAQQQK